VGWLSVVEQLEIQGSRLKPAVRHSHNPNMTQCTHSL
jgi:hypothetical protein